MNKSKFLIALIGPVGSGKTRVARILAQKLKAVHVRTDDIRVALRKKGKSYARARSIANRLIEKALGKGESAIADFDAVFPRRQKELKKRAQKFGAKLIFIKVKTPEKLILRRLKIHRYTARDLFRDAEEAVRVYLIRKKAHEKRLGIRPDFVINNARPLASQIKKICEN